MEAIFWGVLLRIIQSGLQAAPFIFTGLCIGAMLHRLIGHQQTKRLFGSNSVSSLIQSWLIGMLLPGCSLGVIPIVKQLRRSVIPIGTIFAFALSSPLFDPLSLLYGLTLSKPITIVIFATCSLIVVTISGSFFDWLYPNTEITIKEPTPTPYGIKRLVAILVVMARESVSESAVWIGCGLAGVGLLALCLPPGCLQTSMSHSNPWSPLVMTAIAIPAYATPMTAMGQLGSMFQHGNSIGAAFILLIFGAGINLGLLCWMIIYYGWKKTSVWMSIMVGVVLILSYGIERPLYPHDIEAADHTHAFDTYCQPFRADVPPPGGYLAEVRRRLQMETQFHERVGAVLLISLMSLGCALKWLDRRWKIEDWLNRPSAVREETARLRYDIVVPGPVLMGVACLMILAASGVGCLAYYPDADESFEELKLSNVEALSAALRGDRQHALHWIPVSENWLRRLQVGTYLRTGRLGEYQRMKSKVCQEKLERLEHMMEEKVSTEIIKKQVTETSRAFARLKTAFEPVQHN